MKGYKKNHSMANGRALKIRAAFLGCFLSCLCGTAAGAAFAGGLAAHEEDQILKDILRRYQAIYSKYRGIESIVRSVVIEYDAGSDKQKGQTEIVMHRKDYFYGEPEIKVLAYIKDGREKNPASYRSWEMKQGFLVFDSAGLDRYDLKVAGKEEIAGRSCYKIEVTPKKATAQHFKGDIYCDAETLAIARTDGGLGKLRFGLKHYRAVFDYRHTGRSSMVKAGRVEILVDVPIFYPQTLIVTSIDVLSSAYFE
ncbi:MAG TPA: hypothetical protein PLX58_05535 [Smithellaceae bacterium]|jgi:outer membrane lipoprotein-sorting protein|nr:hypothetical protein [Smithellaceae bacterium]HQF84416.1 hypothetical protein [Smithellaceae bacterium]HQG80281.1 hypothetical protein [Smithellaceae bacterium]